MPNPDRSSGHDRKVRIILRAALTLSLIFAFALPALATATTPSQAQRDKTTIRFFVTHPRLAQKPEAQRVLWVILARLDSRLRTLQTVRAWPAHHALWTCIHGGEGNWDDRDSGGNGHYGGLQMHPGWGYGTSYLASDDSQLVQEQSAERAYRASGFSSAWLYQQWAADARCF